MTTLPWLLLPPLLGGAAIAADTPQQAATYALVVGSNRPGPGQETLRFAGDDAERMAEVLTFAGGLEAEHVLQLHDPDADTLLHTLDGFAELLDAHAEAGQRTTFVFYYSGHARAQGLDLGDQSLSLADLRGRLQDLGATVTLTVLDACQSGAVTDAKGVAPAADFSTSSVAGLATEGFAVIASSSDTELSQESEQLQGGIFTHHLASALRGAADVDADGSVTLDEAYQYAYDRTLVSTAATAIGAQHVTLETDLRGQGSLVLTRPQAATARLVLPEALDADLLLVRLPQDKVAAEVHKAPGRSFELALVPGDYRALVRRGETAEACSLTLSEGSTPLPTTGCEPVKLQQVAARGEVADLPQQDRYETFFVEHAFGTITNGDDPYLARLVDFGFGDAEEGEDVDPLFHSNLVLGLHRHLSVVGGIGVLDSDRRTREAYGVGGFNADRDVVFRWTAWRAGVYARGQLPLLDEWLVPYAQAGAGLGWATTRYTDPETEDVRERHLGPMLAGALGLQLMPRLGEFRGVGLYWQTELVTAPVIDNLLGDRHDSGGLVHQLGIRGGF